MALSTAARLLLARAGQGPSSFGGAAAAITATAAATSGSLPRGFHTTTMCPFGSSMFEKLGGRDNVKVAVDKFYEKILADPVTAPFFKDIDMKKQRAKQMQFMILAFGGPNDYKGRSMYEAHKGMALTDDHFNAVAGHFVSTLKELGVGDDVIAEAVAVVETTRPQVLGKQQA